MSSARIHRLQILGAAALFSTGGAAIKACTLTAAESIGLEQDLGSIEVGKLADLVVVEGDPAKAIEDLGNTKMVYQAGARFSPEELRDSVVGKIE